MSKAFGIVAVVILGILTLWIVNIISNVQNANELDYYLLEETTEAAMVDAIDIAYYKYTGGLVRMDREKFLESFVRRFAQNVNGNRDYHIKIIDVNETPPKVSVQVNSSVMATFEGEAPAVINKLDAIIETKYQDDRLLKDVN